GGAIRGSRVGGLPGGHAALPRAQRGPRADTVQGAGMARLSRLDPAPGHDRCGRRAGQRHHPGRGDVACAAARGSGIRGRAMNEEARFGPRLARDGTTFRLWAPAARQVELMLDRAYTMPGRPDGWFELTVPGVGAGA